MTLETRLIWQDLGDSKVENWLKIVENGWKCHGMLEFFLTNHKCVRHFTSSRIAYARAGRTACTNTSCLGAHSQDRWVERLNLSGTKVDSWIVNFGHSPFPICTIGW